MKSTKGRAPWVVVGIVVAAHLVVGAVMMIQGCGTTGPVTPPPEPTMPDGQTAIAPTPVVDQPSAELPVAKPEAKSWAAETTPYTVAKGDFLSTICKRFHVELPEVMALNGIKDANKIRIGQRIMLPGKVNPNTPAPAPKPKKAKPAAPKGSAAVAPAATGSGNVYVVKKGDALSMIAKRHNTTTAALRQANNLKGDKILIGQKLAIPGRAAAAAAAPAVAAPAPVVVPAAAVAAPAVEPVTAEPAADATPPSEFDEMNKETEAPATAAPQTGGMREHVAGQGEDLYTVAMMYGVSVTELKQVNGLTDTALTPGQRLKIPNAQ